MLARSLRAAGVGGLIEAVQNLSIDRRGKDTCSQCERTKVDRWGKVGGEPVCQGCIRLHATLVLNHAESVA